MATPTQQFPPWLTPITSVIENANGVPITTSTTVSFVPLTYYGPSIPLDPDWTYGGISSPASTLSTTAIPSSISTTSTPASISSSVSSPISSIFNTPTPTQSSAVTSNRLTRGQLVGVIVASILGFIFILALILAIYLFCKDRRRRKSRDIGASIDDDYYVVSGSPRLSGEEADPFLVQRRGGRGGMTRIPEKNVEGGSTNQYTEIGARPPQPPIVSRVPPPPATTIASLGSSNSSSTNSGYGEPLAQPTLSIRPIREEYEQETIDDTIPSSEESYRLDQEAVVPLTEEQEDDSGRYSGAYAYRAEIPFLPPKLVDPPPKSPTNFTLPRPPFAKRPSKPSFTSHRSSLPLDVDENATLLTARRVKIEDLGPRIIHGSSPIEDRASKPSTSSFLGSLSAIAGRLSRRRSESLYTSQHQPLLQSSPLSDQDLEYARLPPPIFTPHISEPILSRGSVDIGLNPDGLRPISDVSGRSQNSGVTLYHDALSSPPESSSDVASGMASSSSTTKPTVPSQLSQSQMPSYDYQPPTSTASPSGDTSHAQAFDLGYDVLDVPAPSAIFKASSNPSLQTSTSGATVVDRTIYKSIHSGCLLPPGFDAIPQSTQSERSKGATSSSGINQDIGSGTTIDVLEEEPPTAGEGWRSMAAVTSTSIGGDERLARKTTFGVPIYVAGIDFTSEQDSLHSMRSHVGPSSPPRSTGSAAASTRRELLYGSSSSHPSTFSAARSTGTSGSAALSFAQSIARSGSITSDGRRRGYISPALSAFGNRIQDSSKNDFAVSREGDSSGCSSRSDREGGMLQSPSTAYLRPEKAATTVSSVLPG